MGSILMKAMFSEAIMDKVLDNTPEEHKSTFSDVLFFQKSMAEAVDRYGAYIKGEVYKLEMLQGLIQEVQEAFTSGAQPGVDFRETCEALAQALKTVCAHHSIVDKILEPNVRKGFDDAYARANDLIKKMGPIQKAPKKVGSESHCRFRTLPIKDC
ncbi:MAG: hypothetical protein PHS86_14625 [Syntrophaceae bacterium]|nr:hypothetical protein [Syntrophaceae bacterium]